MGLSFLKRGKAAIAANAKADAEAEVRSAARGLRRFWLPKDGESALTFLDGELTPDGLLQPGVAYTEHKLFLNGHWRNYFPCTAEEEPCPLCQQEAPKTLVNIFTVIDHNKWEDRNGKKHTNERKVFVAKRDTMKRLQKMASKRGGLVGWRVAIGRTGDRSPEVGTDFDFLEKQDLAELAKDLKLKPEEIQPFDYDKEIKYFKADELVEMGFGTHVVGQHDTKKLKQAAKKKPSKASDDDDEDFDDDAPQDGDGADDM